MRTASTRLAAERLSTWSAAFVPIGTPMRHVIGADEPEIRLILGTENPVELVMDPRAASEVVMTLQQAIREFYETNGVPPVGPNAA